MGVVLLLVLISVLNPLTAASQPPPTLPHRHTSNHPIPHLPILPSSNLPISLAVVKSAITGTDDPTGVYNGETVTYTILLDNQSVTTLTEILVIDLLPRDTLDRIVCADSCALIGEKNEIPEPSGGTIVVTATRQISWTIPALGVGERVTRTFSGRVIGQGEGTVFTNRAFVSYVADGVQRSASSNDLALTAHIRIQTDSGATISAVPTWFSDDVGGTVSQDWGDLDRDGDLDLALGSSLGASIYRNEAGQLAQIWSSPSDEGDGYRLSYGVRWADLDRDALQYLELVVVGNSIDHSATGAGINYVYAYSPALQEFVQTDVFTSAYQLVRLATGDYDGDGDIDLVASTNAINAPCPVNLYRNDGSGHFTGTVASALDHDVECLSHDATAAIGSGDYDGDGDLDLAIGGFPNILRLLINDSNGGVITNSNPFTATSPITVETELEYLPYDLAWGDYDHDGYLDLAGAYPLQREVRIYQNQSGSDLALVPQSIRTSPFMTPLAIEWGDFDGDGRLDLAVADSPPRVYQYDEATGGFTWISSLALPPSGGQVWSVRGVDLGNKGNLDLVMSNQDGPSERFTTLAPRLKSTITPVSTQGGGSVAWGDADNDGDLDLLLGSGPPPGLSSYLHINEGGEFATRKEFEPSGFGPHIAEFGDVDGDGKLDVAIGTPAAIQVYNNGNTTSAAWSVQTAQSIHSLAWGDANDDGRLDLLVGKENGLIYLYLNQGTQLFPTPAFTATAPGDVRSLAWGDYDGDYYLDFAAGVHGGPARVYRNEGDGSFSLGWSAPFTMPTSALAWADYDDDGDLDLAIGNYGGDDYVWENVGGTFPNDRVWNSSTPASKTTSLAWGDWNNDGYPELAVGKDGQPDVVYANLGSEPASPQLFALWSSAEVSATSAIAWGDRDNDGDLDLAVSQRVGESASQRVGESASQRVGESASRGAGGFYENTLVAPAHLPGYADASPDDPPYLYVERPGSTADAYFYSAPATLAGPAQPTVTVQYRLYDPGGDPVAATFFEYSLSGGSLWETATPAAGSPAPITRTSPGGETGTFVWDAAHDDAISDNARFRIRVVHGEPTGPAQRASSSGISPPFRVRALDCFWPADVSIIVHTDDPQPREGVEFEAHIGSASGPVKYYWDFGDGETGEGWQITHQYGNGVFAVTLRVDGEACPIARPGYAQTEVTVGTGVPDKKVYLPLVLREGESGRVEEGESGADQSPNLPVTQYALGVNSQPSVNSDGTRVVFWTTGRLTGQNPDGNIEVFLADVEGGGVEYTQITSSTGSILGGFNLAPVIDDTGERIAFFSDRDLVGQNGEGNFEVFLAEVPEGASPTLVQVTQTPGGVNILPDISGDGRFVAFASDNDLTQTGQQIDGQTEVYRAEVGQSGEVTFTRVTTISGESGANDQPAINQDGRFVAFVSDQNYSGMNPDGNREIFRAEIGLTQVTYTQITSSTGGMNEIPSISADGGRIAFVSDQNLDPWGDNTDGTRQVFLAEVSATTGEVTITQITHSGGDKDQTNISADGTRIAYVSVSDRRLHVYDTIDKEEPPGDTGAGNAYPSLSPDGTKVAFVSNWDIFLADYPLVDLTVSKSADRDEVAGGETLTYTIVITNNGPSQATGVILNDTLSPGVEALPFAPHDYSDDNNLTTGFGGGTHNGTDWNASDEWLEIITTTNAFGLPDFGGNADGWADMAGNILLLHLDDVAGSTTFLDTSGLWNSGSCADVTCPTAGEGGKVGDALEFDGADDYVEVPHAAGLNPDEELTMAVWVKLDTPSADQKIVGKTTIGDGYLLGVGNSSLYPEIWDSAGQRYSFRLGTIPADIWTHLAVTWRTGGDMIGYVDGREVGRIQASTRPIGSNGNPVRIGAAPWNPNYYRVNGLIDEIAIFTQALTPDEIQAVYQRQSPVYAAYFDSRVMTQAAGVAGWNSIAWLPSRPTGKELPDYGNAKIVTDTGYLTGSVDMSGNILLLHVNEPDGSTAFLDTSGAGNDGDCSGSACPTAGVNGWFKQALHFDQVDDYIIINPINEFPATEITAMFWMRSTNTTLDAAPLSYAVPGHDNEFGLFNDRAFRVHVGNAASVRTGVAANDGQWHHIAVTWRSSDGLLLFYKDGEEEWTATTQQGYTLGSQGALVFGQDQDRVGGRFDPRQAFQGDMDEIAIFNRVLTSDEIQDHYLRGALRMQFQVRSCDDEGCDDEPFAGPDDTRTTYYSALTNPTLDPPALPLDVADNPYFQYRVYVDTYIAQTWSPELISVTVSPWVECDGTSPVTCSIGTPVNFLAPNSAVAVDLPVHVSLSAVEGKGAITNTAVVDGNESDHNPADNRVQISTSSKHVPLSAVTIRGPDEGRVGGSHTFTATVGPGNASLPVTYTWRATGQSGVEHVVGLSDTASFIWATAGIKTIIVAADNGPGPVVSDVHTITIEIPITGLNAVNDGPTVLKDATTLTATVTGGTNVAYEWAFGDGISGNGPVVTHTYATGTYTAVVTARNSVSVVTATTTVTVAQAITGLSAANDSPTMLEEVTTLTATITGGSGVAYEWAFGDGDGGSGPVVTHAYATTGTHTAVVTASNSVSVVTATTTVTITDVPIAGLDATNDGPTVLDEITTLTATVTGGTNVAYEWAFGDGISGSGPVVTHTYATGTYTAVVTASNSVSVVTATTTVTVDEAITGLSADNDSPTMLGGVTTLTATVTGGTNVAYEWAFGDGNSGSGPVVTHTYATTGTHTAIVTASNSVSVVTATTTVTITDAPIAGLGAANDGPTVLNDATTLTATVTGGTNVAYEWAFGDGDGGSGPVVTHPYAAPGTYTAVVTASNSVSVVTATTTVTVDEAITGLSAANDGPTVPGNVTHLTATITGGTNVVYKWAFGDGDGGSGPVVTHTYATTGTYTAVVTASNSVSVVTATTTVTVTSKQRMRQLVGVLDVLETPHARFATGHFLPNALIPDAATPRLSSAKLCCGGLVAQTNSANYILVGQKR